MGRGREAGNHPGHVDGQVIRGDERPQLSDGGQEGLHLRAALGADGLGDGSAGRKEELIDRPGLPGATMRSKARTSSSLVAGRLEGKPLDSVCLRHLSRSLYTRGS